MARIANSPAIQGKQDWSSKYLAKDDANESRLLRWWYHLSAPPAVPSTASFRDREVARRGKLTSLVLFFFFILIVAVGVPVRVIQDPPEIILLAVLLLPLVLATGFNRRGNVNVSGAIVVSVLALGLTLVLTLFQKNGLTVNSIALYDITIQVVLFTVSLLPAPMVFLAAGYNCLFIILDFFLLPHAPDLNALVVLSGPDVLVRPIGLNLSVAVITYLWVTSATKALKRADRAEVIAKLEHDLVMQTRIVVEQKQQLDTSIEQILYTLTQAANGNLDARTPLTEENVLWPVAGAINNLLARFQRARQMERGVEALQLRLHNMKRMENQFVQLQRENRILQEALTKQIWLMREAKNSHKPMQFRATQTRLDPWLEEMHGCYLIPAEQAKNY